MHAVHIFACGVFLVAIVSSDAQEEIIIDITGPVQVIRGSQEGHKVPTAEQCTGENGFCVETGDHCNGTIKILRTSCFDHCTCCVPEKQVGCSVDEGFFILPGSTQCLKEFHDEELTWTAAGDKCKAEGLALAQPDDAPAVQKYLNDTYPDSGWSNYFWVDCRGDGSSRRWQRTGDVLDPSNPWWLPGEPREGSTHEAYCITLAATDMAMKEAPGQPYVTWDCHDTLYPLCQVVME